MQRESFRNAEIARLLNERTIPVKVDRELAPGLDAILQEFSAATRGQSGWPLNVFVTPEGYPLVALLYAPPEDFERIVTGMTDRWRMEPERLALLARSAALPSPPPKKPPAHWHPEHARHYRDRLVQAALGYADPLGGGFGKGSGASKFPHAPQLRALLPLAHRDAALAQFLRHTLAQMATLGLYDHVGGGFFRYTVDPDWRTPHFEKMLYDNAQLAAVYWDAAEVLRAPEFSRVAEETLDFLLRDLWDEARGAFYTSTSAVDDRGREGGYYLWDEADLATVLDARELALVRRIWRLDLPSTFEAGGHLPLHATTPTIEERDRLATLYAKLRAAREARSLPRDTKLLTGLNGLALAALVRTGQPRHLAAAQRVRAFLVGMIGPSGLRKGEANGQPLGEADLEDYAYAVHGLLAHARSQQDGEALRVAERLATLAWQKFHGPQGWQLEARPLLARPANEDVIADGPLPSPSALLIEASLALGSEPLRSRALAALATGHDLLDRDVFWYASQVHAMARAR